MNTLTITLRQHTPLIHFQHYQYNATLRASEVKPKLDKFILGKLGENNYEAGKEKAKENGWLIGEGEHPALNYKMKIIPVGEVATWEINTPNKSPGGTVKLDSYPLFFANIDKDYKKLNELKQFSFVNQLKLELYFPDKVTSLYDWIKEEKQRTLFSRFFFFNNFGARNSKGFGSFYPEEQDERFVSFGKENKYLFNSKYLFDIDSTFDINSIEEVKKESKLLFENIELLYKALRGGIDIIEKKGDRFKFKSLLQQYCYIKWKRSWEKQKILDILNKESISSTQTLYYDVKDLLGFSTVEKWEAEHHAEVKRCIAIEDEEKGWKKPTSEEKKALPERMKSPILFKPLYDEDCKCYRVYIRPMQKTVHSLEFANYRKVCVSVSSNDQLSEEFFIDLPNDFVVSDFLDYVFNRSKLNFATYVNKRYRDSSYCKKLQNIYNNIVSNLNKSPQ